MNSPSHPDNSGNSRPRPPRNKAKGGDSPTAVYADVDRLTGLLQQISTLAEESLRSVGEAQKTLTTDSLLDAANAMVIEKQLSDASSGLERMAELVHAAMQGASQPLGSTTLNKARPVTLGEALQHASEVMSPMARERFVEIVTTLAPGAAGLPAGALYTVILNGLQNAVEAISRRGGHGRVEISVKNDAAPTRRGYGRDARDWFVLEITDDGSGPPSGPDLSRVFNLGFSTKPRGSGVGLAVAKSVVQGMGGTIELAPRTDGSGGTLGAVLKVRFPAPQAPSTVKLGGAA